MFIVTASVRLPVVYNVANGVKHIPHGIKYCEYLLFNRGGIYNTDVGPYVSYIMSYAHRKNSVFLYMHDGTHLYLRLDPLHNRTIIFNKCVYILFHTCILRIRRVKQAYIDSAKFEII